MIVGAGVVRRCKVGARALECAGHGGMASPGKWAAGPIISSLLKSGLSSVQPRGRKRCWEASRRWNSVFACSVEKSGDDDVDGLEMKSMD